MTDGGRQNAVRCKCGVLLGHLTERRPRWIIRAPFVVLVIDFTFSGAALICPACGEHRIFRADAIRGIVLRDEECAVHSAQLKGDERAAE